MDRPIIIEFHLGLQPIFLLDKPGWNGRFRGLLSRALEIDDANRIESNIQFVCVREWRGWRLRRQADKCDVDRFLILLSVWLKILEFHR